MTTHTASDYTSPPDQLSSPSSLTPTRHALQQTSMLDFTSPSAYLNHDAYNHTSPNSPHGSACLHDLTYDMHGSASAPPASIDETFAYAYGDYSAENGYMPMAPIDHSTPSALRMEDDRTPVISDKQHPIQPSSLPCRPNVHGDETIRASSQSHRTLMSPFRTFSNQPNMMAFPESVSEQHQLIDPSQAFYPQPQPQPPQSYAYSNGSPHDPSGFVTMPQYVNMQPGLGGQIYPPPGQYYTQPLQPYDFPGPRPRSRNGSPTESVSSSAASIARSGSTSSELRQARPKVKLTFEDKRNIVELHRANSSLRQEDIARQYG